MSRNQEKIEAAFMLASYLDTIGFKNGNWEFNYGKNILSLNDAVGVWCDMLNEFNMLGGVSHINIKGWHASDDTIMLHSTALALLDDNNYKKQYLLVLPLLKKDIRASGITLLNSLELIKFNKVIKYNKMMGGNGAAMRTGPIGIKYNDNEAKIIEESIICGKLTHNYYVGFLGGAVTALFSAYAFRGIAPWLWVESLLSLYEKGIFYKFHQDKCEVDEFIKYWKRYQEVRIQHIKKKNYTKSFVSAHYRLSFLMSFNPSANIQHHVNANQSLYDKKDIKWNQMGITGIDVNIFALDCLLSSIVNMEMKEIVYSWSSFLTNIAIHPGDSDTTGAIGGFWYGLLLGYNGFDRKKMKELEFYPQLLDVSKQMFRILS